MQALIFREVRWYPTAALWRKPLPAGSQRQQGDIQKPSYRLRNFVTEGLKKSGETIHGSGWTPQTNDLQILRALKTPVTALSIFPGI